MCGDQRTGGTNCFRLNIHFLLIKLTFFGIKNFNASLALLSGQLKHWGSPWPIRFFVSFCWLLIACQLPKEPRPVFHGLGVFWTAKDYHSSSSVGGESSCWHLTHSLGHDLQLTQYSWRSHTWAALSHPQKVLFPFFTAQVRPTTLCPFFCIPHDSEQRKERLLSLSRPFASTA